MQFFLIAGFAGKRSLLFYPSLPTPFILLCTQNERLLGRLLQCLGVNTDHSCKAFKRSETVFIFAGNAVYKKRLADAYSTNEHSELWVPCANEELKILSFNVPSDGPIWPAGYAHSLLNGDK